MSVMKIYKIVWFAICCLLCMTNCQSNSESQSAKENISGENSLARKYVDENIYINVSDLDLMKEASKARTGTNVEREALMNAAIYRFYSHVKMENGFYSCSLTSADEINVSPNVFDFLKDNLEEMNDSIRAFKERGEEINVFEINEEYLNSLLK